MRTVLLCLFLAGCATQSVPTAVTPVDYRPLAATVLIDDDSPAPVVPPAPVSGVCGNCNGKGKLGDGTVFVDCPVCGGDGKITSEDGQRISAMVQQVAAFGKEKSDWQAERNKLLRDMDAISLEAERRQIETIVLKQKATSPPARAATRTPTVTYYYPATRSTVPQPAPPAGNCAGGNCSTQSYSTGPVRRFLFGR